jgi:hypothetical protein
LIAIDGRGGEEAHRRGEGRQMRGIRFTSLFGAAALMLLPNVVTARLDHGGWMSRDLAVGEADEVETVYATTVSDADDVAATPLCATATGPSCSDFWCCGAPEWGTLGDCAEEPMTLWAFCANGDCSDVSDDDRDCKPSNHAEYDPVITERLCDLCDKPCKWRRPLCGSKGTPSTGSDPGGISGSSYAPPVVSADGKHIFAASVDGNVYAFDDAGNLLWKWDAVDNDQPDAQFYARPALDEWEESECTRRSLYLASVDGRLFAFHADDDACTGTPAPGTLRSGYPFAPKVGLGGSPATGDFLFEPIVDPKHTYPPGSTTRVANAQGCPRVYIASDKNTEGIWAIDTCSDGDDDPATAPDDPTAGDPDTGLPDTLWRCFWKTSGSGNNKALASLSFKLGGTIYEEPGLRRLLLANGETGTVAIDLDNPPQAQNCGGPPEVQTSPNREYWIHKVGSVGNQDERTHRSYPTISQPQDEHHPAVYLTGKGGAIVHLSMLATGTTPVTINSVTYHHTTPIQLDEDHATDYLFPASGTIPDLSFSSATANPHAGSNAGFLFFGAAKDEGVYRVDPNGGSSAEPAWFDYKPEDGWRTTPVFTGAGARIHIGSAKSILYGLDVNASCGQTLWCWDARLASQLAAASEKAGGQCPDADADCCEEAALATSCPLP